MKSRADRVYVIPGNHESADQISAFCARFGFHDFHGQRMEIGRYHVAGLGYSSPTPFDTPGEYSEDQLAARLGRFAGLQPLIMVCHCPPYGSTLDRVREGVHAGSTAVRDFIAARAARIFLLRPHPRGRRIERRPSAKPPPSTSARKAICYNWIEMTVEELEREYLPLREQAIAVRSYL